MTLRGHVFCDLDETLVHTRLLGAVSYATWAAGAYPRPGTVTRIAERVARRRQSEVAAVERGDGCWLEDEDGCGFVTFLRPGAHDFLTKLAAAGCSLHLLTAASRPYLEQVTAAFDLDRIFHSMHSVRDWPEVYGEGVHPDNSLRMVHQNRPWVLVDDLEPGTIGFRQKWTILADPNGFFVQVPPFTGRFEDTALDLISRQVLRILS